MTAELVQVKIQVPAIPEPTGNLDEVQANIDTLLASYTGRVYTAEEIKSAKDDRAQVNKWDKQLAEAAKAIKDKYLEKVDPLLDRIAEMRGQVKQVSAAIDQQVKDVEEAEREDKRKALQQIYQEAAGEDLSPIVPFSSVLDRRWLNKTAPLSTAGRELRKLLEQRREELRIIRETCGDDADACIAEYTRDFRLNDALREYQRRKDLRLAAAQAEAARAAAEQARKAAPVTIPPSDEERQIKAEASAAAHAGAFVTGEGRLDTGLLQMFAQPQEPERRRYRFWVEFTQEDIRWFKAAAAERGFLFGSIK